MITQACLAGLLAWPACLPGPPACLACLSASHCFCLFFVCSIFAFCSRRGSVDSLAIAVASCGLRGTAARTSRNECVEFVGGILRVSSCQVRSDPIRSDPPLFGWWCLGSLVALSSRGGLFWCASGTLRRICFWE